MEQQKLVFSEKTNKDDVSYQDEPELRFPEFNEKWNVKTIKSVAQVIGGGTPKTDNVQYWDGEINWFTPSEIGNKYIFDSERKITEEGLKKSSAKLLPINSILLSTRATIGETSIIKKESTTNQGFQSLVVKENYNYEFIYYLIQLLKNEMLKRSSGSTFLEISKKEVEKILIKTPNLDEQNKIAQFLSAVDKKIELLEKNQVLYEKQKNYYMNKIFSEYLQNINLNQFKLKNVCEKIENGFSGQQVPYETEFPVTRIETMSSGEINYDKVGFVEEIDERYRLREGDILLTNINSLKWIGNVVYFEDEKPLYHGMNLMLLRPKQEFNSKYIYYYITSHNKWFKKMACQAVNQASINKSTLEKFIVFVPKVEIQDKIANLLTNMDKKIILSERNTLALNKFKKSLLQKMFV